MLFTLTAKTSVWKGGGDYDSSIEAFEKGAEYFNINFNDVEKAHETGVSLYEKYELLPTPMTGINVKTFWEFRKSEKTINEKRVLLANLAIKSVLQEQSFCKITFDFMLSRMDGMSKKFKDTGELSDEIRILRDRRKLRGLKRELKRSWGFTTFDGRGTYWSSKMSIDDLTYHVMKNSKVQKDKKIKKLEYEAIEKAKLRLLWFQKS